MTVKGYNRIIRILLDLKGILIKKMILFEYKSIRNRTKSNFKLIMGMSIKIW